MNIIVTNRCRELIYSTNIEVLKEMNGIFKVRQIVNNLNSLFYKKIIIDASALEGFPNEMVLRELVNSFDKDKLILFLPPDNPPPKKFLSFLVSINLYNFTDNPKGLIELINNSNTYDKVSNFVIQKPEEPPKEEENLYDNTEAPGRIVLGFRSTTENNFSTEIIYMIKKSLEEVHHKSVIAVEVNKKDFIFYNSSEMYSITADKLPDFIKNNLGVDLILVDLNEYNGENVCDDIINLVNPSLFTVNKLLYKSRDAFIKLKGEKVVFVNSLLAPNEISQFAKEANITVYYNLSPLNDRIHNQNLDKFLIKLGIIEDNSKKSTKKGLFSLFK